MNTIPFRTNRRLVTLLGSNDPFDALRTWQPPGAETVRSTLPVTVENTDEGSTITVDMPGVDPADLDLTLEDGTLTIVGKRRERTYRYAVTLDARTDPSTVEASLTHGVLTVQTHTRPEAKPRKIAITVGQNTLAQGETK